MNIQNREFLGRAVALALLATFSLPGAGQQTVVAPPGLVAPQVVTTLPLAASAQKPSGAVGSSAEALLANVSANLEQQLETTLAAPQAVEGRVQSHSQVARIER